jgi:hypothetical protein
MNVNDIHGKPKHDKQSENAHKTKKSQAHGRQIEHKKSKSQKIYLSLEDLQKVGLDVNYKSVSPRKRENLSASSSTDEAQTTSSTDEAKEGVYIPKKVLEIHGKSDSFKSIQTATSESLLSGATAFAKAKSPSITNLQPPKDILEPKAVPKKWLTRLLTGNVKPEWIVGLGKMKADKITPEEGYKDCFVSSLEEYEKKGIHFDSHKINDPAEMAKRLDLLPSDIELIKKDGVWLILIYPGFKVAIPTDRKSEWNKEYVEGGYTQSGQQEWVIPNIATDYESRAKNIKIFKISPKGETVEWKFFMGTLYPDIPDDIGGAPVKGSYNHAIDAYIKTLPKKTDKTGG